jgi:hypothetical protein
MSALQWLFQACRVWQALDDHSFGIRSLLCVSSAGKYYLHACLFIVSVAV